MSKKQKKWHKAFYTHQNHSFESDKTKNKIIALLLTTLAILPTVVLSMPTTKNKHVDTFGGGAATVLMTGNKFDGPNHIEDWYNGKHYNCFRKASLSDKEIQQKLSHG